MPKKIFNLPDLGEGLPEAEIRTWHIKTGDEVAIDQTLVSVETAKAVVEVPSPYKGKVLKIYGNAGDIIPTGSPLIEFEVEAGAEVKDTKEHKEDTGTVVGVLTASSTTLQEPHFAVAPSPEALGAATSANRAVKAIPAIRALAQQLKVDLSQVTPTGPEGVITKSDVEIAAKMLAEIGVLEPLKGPRRVMAQNMRQSHLEVVPVTVTDDAILLEWSKEEDLTVRIIQAIVVASRKEPALNAWYDGQSIARRIIKTVNIGLAIDSTEGLFVPVIHDAGALNSKQLRERINSLKEGVKNRTLAPQDFRGASFTISNFGIFAGRYANPIIIPPTVSILGIGKLREEVVAKEGKAVVCPVLPLALTFDHRAVTGGEATRFLGLLIAALQEKH